VSYQITWLAARFLDIDGSARPGSYADSQGNQNAVAALRITDQNSADGLVIEGRPEDLVVKAREILRAAELVVEQTMRDPQLRSMYGLVQHDTKPAGGFMTVELGKLPTRQVFLPEAVMGYVDQQRALGKTDGDILDDAMDAYMRGDLDTEVVTVPVVDQERCAAAGGHLRSANHAFSDCATEILRLT
jgi:hypothetical protein